MDVRADNGESRELKFFAPFKNLTSAPCGLKTEIVSVNASTVGVSVESTSAALFVTLAVTSSATHEVLGRWSDNAFHLLPDDGRRVVYLDLHPTEIHDGNNSLAVEATCLHDTKEDNKMAYGFFYLLLVLLG